MLRLHGVPLSQPFRSVAWGLLQHKIPFKVEICVPGSTAKAGSRAEPFLSKGFGALGNVPMIEEPSSGFTLAESPAILSYLAETQQWGMLPTSADDRAKVSSFMHWHHSGTRTLASVFANYVRADKRCSAEELEQRMAKASATLATVETVWLADAPFLAGQPHATVADLLAYEEVVQMRPEYLNLGIDFEPLPKVRAWCDRMRALPFHDEAHTALAVLGDLRTPSDVSMAKRLGEATKAALKAITAAQVAY